MHFGNNYGNIIRTRCIHINFEFTKNVEYFNYDYKNYVIRMKNGNFSIVERYKIQVK